MLEQIISFLESFIQQGLVWSFLGLGVYISYRILDYADLTAEGSFTLGGAVSAYAIVNGINPVFALILGIVAGALSGMITGIIHTKLKIPMIVAGIISMTGLYSINLAVIGGALISLRDYETIYSVLFNDTIDNKLMIIIITLVIVVAILALLYWFFGTEFGMAVRATGNNQNMARAQGVNTTKMIIIGLAMGNALISLSGGLYAMAQKSITVDAGRGTIVIGLASVIIGEVIFGKKSFKNSIISVVLGSIFYFLLLSLAARIGIDTNWFKLISAVLIVFILSLPLIKKQMKSRQVTKGGNPNA